ncbi:hypothetical protein F4778DRAFT_802138 [Xylariomycetidae sp. FL2044]|nr:hypothetical protein F4778DRAFT_802138 [Xylariomycetidae sp. FL2044]
MGQLLSRPVGRSRDDCSILPLVNLASLVPAAVAGHGNNLAVVRVVIESQKSFFLVDVGITKFDSAEVVMGRIQTASEGVTRFMGVRRLLHNIFWGQGIALATLSTFRNVEVQTRHRAPLEVNIRSREPCPDLNRPDLIDNDRPFVTLYPEVLHGNLSSKVVLLEKKLKKENVLWCAIGALIIGVAVGVVVGMLTRNVGVGIGTSAGIIAVVAFLVRLSTWVTERSELE